MASVIFPKGFVELPLPPTKPCWTKISTLKIQILGLIITRLWKQRKSQADSE
jgi:hypothetical protein